MPFRGEGDKREKKPKPAVRKKTSCRRAGNDILNWIPGHPSAL